MDKSDILKSLFDKEIICPVCGNSFKVKVVKVNSTRIASKDSDFFINYLTINPYFYDIWLCNKCGYATIKSDFFNIKHFQKDLVKCNITPKWISKAFPEIIDIDNAIKRYKLALVTAITITSHSSVQAMILLKIAWMYRMKNDKEKEKLFLSKSLTAFLKAYNSEEFPIYGMDRNSIHYLLGELNRRTDKNEDAVTWYSKVFNDIHASKKIRDLSRTGIDIIKRQY